MIKASEVVCILAVVLFVAHIVLPRLGWYPGNMIFTCPLSWEEFVSLHKSGGYKAVEKYQMYWVDWEIPNVKPVLPSRAFYRVDVDGWRLNVHTDGDGELPDLPPAEIYRVRGWVGFLLEDSIDLGRCTIEPINAAEKTPAAGGTGEPTVSMPLSLWRWACRPAAARDTFRKGSERMAMKLNERIDDMRMADAISRIGFRISGGTFYSNFGRDKPLPKLLCELQSSAVQELLDYDMKKLADDLNTAIAPVIEKWREKYLEKVRCEIGAPATP